MRHRLTRRGGLAVLATATLALAGCGGGGGNRRPAGTGGVPVGASVAAAAYPTVRHGTLLIQERSSQYADSPGAQSIRSLLAVTRNGGRTWRVTPTSLPAAPGITMAFDGPSDGWLAGAYVTHDGGRRWSKVAVPGHPDLAVTSVSIAGATVWATAERRSGRIIVLTGPASGSTLTPTASPPRSGGTVVATGATDAVVADTDPAKVVATASGGHAWRTATAPCPTDHPVQLQGLGASGRTLVQICGSRALDVADEIARSTDAGRSWTDAPDPAGVTAPQLASARIGWSTCGADSSEVCRSTDGGGSWTAVWPPPKSHITGLQLLAVTGPRTAHAAVVSTLAGATQLTVYTTTDGGASWTPSTVPLPTGG